MKRLLRTIFKPIIKYLYDRFCVPGEHSRPYEKAFLDGQKYGENRVQAQIATLKESYEYQVKQLLKR
jgi:hypothetical protein